MPAQEREQEQGPQPTHSVPSASPTSSVLSMRELLASCAAADAVSKPPSPPEEPQADTRAAPQDRPDRNAA